MIKVVAMCRKRAVTLVELVIAISLIGVIAVAISSAGSILYVMKQDVLENQQPLVQGIQATTLIFERVLRATAQTSGAAFTILEGGKRLEYKRSGVTERIWQEEDKIKYNDGSLERIILKGVSNLYFSQAFSRRLVVDINMTNGQNFRTAVQPRNEFTPGDIIN